ncbi:MAG TPA: RNA methyltransferase [Acidimicrobiales bacterium]
MAVWIDDPDDPRVADYVDLTDSQMRRRSEPGAGVFIVEGALTLAALARSRYAARSVMVTPSQAERLRDLLDGLGAPVLIASQPVMNRVTGFNIHRGVLAAAARPPLLSPDEVAGLARVLVVGEDLNDQENLGALFRNARALGVGGVLLSPGCCDPLYRRTVRVSLGHVLHVPFAVLRPWPSGLLGLRAKGFEVLALTPGPDAEPIGAVDAAGAGLDRRVAVLVGAEGAGLSPAALAYADRRVRIPMAPGVDSLNVATAAAIAFHHLGAAPT